MSKIILRNAWLIILIASCAPASHNSSRMDRKALTSDFKEVDTAGIANDFLEGQKPLSLTDLPRTEDGAFVLSAGYYEADFKTYCLQPGSPDPSARDAYYQSSLKGYRKDIIETILRNSQNDSYLEQRNIQLLLWSVVSGSNFNSLSPAVQSTAEQLLSPKQIFELKGGTIGLIRSFAAAMPSSNTHNEIKRLFEIGYTSYEAYEKIAVPRHPSEIRRPDFKKDQWYKHRDGYYVRYYPGGYQHTRIQVYVPETVDTASKTGEGYIVFDPASRVLVPANSNAQRLGVGGTVVDVVRKIIRIKTGSGNPKTAPAKTNQDPKY